VTSCNDTSAGADINKTRFKNLMKNCHGCYLPSIKAVCVRFENVFAKQLKYLKCATARAFPSSLGLHCFLVTCSLYLD